jgi:Zn-dependent M28 family amino/carboxypeptidase
LPDPDPAWTTTLQDEVVSKLSGHAEIAPGVRLVNRATLPNRQAARQYLASALSDMGLTPLEQNYGSGTNVYAEVKSTSGGRSYVVVGAHFDSVPPSPGANDNATGVAAVLATARYVTSLPCRSKNFFFVLFDEEEVGLVGSKNFATKLKTDGVMVHSVHTIDQMGWDQNDDRLIELELPDTGLEQFYRTGVAELGVSIPIKVTKTSSTDHSSFRPAFLATGVTEGYTSDDTTPYYHTAGDTYETVKFAYLRSTTTLVNRVMADLSR